MVLSTRKGTFTKSTNTSVPVSQEINFGSPTFQPKAIWFTCVATTNESYAEGATITYGFSDGTTDACTAQAQTDNQDTSSTGGVIRDDSCICILDTLNPTTVLARATISSFDADGFTLSWITNNSSAYVIHYFAVGGDDITNVKVMNTTIGTADAEQFSYTGVGFQGDFANFLTTHDSAAINTPGTGYHFVVGAARSSTKRWVIGGYTQTGQGTNDAYSVYQNDKCLASWDSGNGNMKMEADLVSFDSNGLTLNYTIGLQSATQRLAFIVIKGGLWDVGDFAANNTTNNQVISLTSGINPELVAFFSSQSTLSDTGTPAASHNRIMIGAADNDLNQGIVWSGDNDGVGTTETARIQLTTAVIRTATPAATASSTTTDGEADIFGMTTADQFEIDWTDAINQRFAWFVVGKTTAVEKAVYIAKAFFQSDN